MKAFLTPMSVEEELEYIQRMKKGDILARNMLIERNMRLVAHIAKKYQTPEEEMEDLISIGTYGLIKAIMTFDSEKGNRLVTYSAKCIENELLMYKRGKKKTAKDVSLYEPIATDREGNHLRLMDILESGEDELGTDLERQECIHMITENMEKVLTEREYKIITLRYGMNHEREYTQNEVAKLLNISRSYVSRIEKKALDKLREFVQL